jgi:hypothetical protein
MSDEDVAMRIAVASAFRECGLPSDEQDVDDFLVALRLFGYVVERLDHQGAAPANVRAPDRAALRRHWARAAMPPHVGGEMRPTDVGRIRVYNAANSETIRCPESTSFACF